MNRLIIGSNTTGKTTTIKDIISTLEGKVIVLDFKDEYNDFSKNRFLLDDVNPLMSEISLDDAKALNAGYLTDGSRLLFKKCEELLREHKSFMPELKGISFDEIRNTMKRKGLVEEAIDRLINSYDDRVECEYGKILSSKISSKVRPHHISLEKACEDILSNDKVLFKSKSMHSDHQRAISFILLSRLSKMTTEPIWIVADDLTQFFNNGNIKFFLEALKLQNLNFIFSYNKSINIPKVLIPYFDEVYLHRFESNTEIKDLITMKIIPETTEAEFEAYAKKIKTLKDGKYQVHSLNQLQLT